MLSSLWVSESLGKPEIDQVNVRRFLVTDQEVVWLYISVQIVARLHVLDSLQTLDSNHDDSLQGEPLFAIPEQVFQRWSQKLHDHNIVVSFNNCPLEFRDSFSFKQFKKLSLV